MYKTKTSHWYHGLEIQESDEGNGQLFFGIYQHGRFLAGFDTLADAKATIDWWIENSETDNV